jgi:hypothetical protein
VCAHHVMLEYITPHDVEGCVTPTSCMGAAFDALLSCCCASVTYNIPAKVAYSGVTPGVAGPATVWHFVLPTCVALLSMSTRPGRLAGLPVGARFESGLIHHSGHR